jgi:hypothetical protein
MITPLRRVGIVVLAMFAALFVSSSVIHVVASEDIALDSLSSDLNPSLFAP